MATPSSLLVNGLLSLLCCLALAAAQSLTPANGTSPLAASQASSRIGFAISRSDGLPAPGILALIPLVDAALDDLPTSGVGGTIFPATTSNIDNITASSIAWISCDPADYVGNLGAVDVLQRAVENNASAALLYSRSSSYCNYTVGSNIQSSYNFLYSMSNSRDSDNLATMMTYMTESVPLRASINLAARFQSNSTNSSSSSTQQSSTPGGPSPSTAVAMIILYSITGVITALFLIIIITGAIRAHRHPERYGPRAVLGRTRQSRARGLARAMLDSIPIVKFGEQDGDVPKPEDVELGAAEGSNAQHSSPEAEEANKEAPNAEATTERETHEETLAAERAAETNDTPRASMESGIGANIAVTTPPKPSGAPGQPLGCSICTEDFERGEDVRVLPCNHKFHPACIDPWLLNVSGTCPLCRIDLRPPTADGNADPSSDSASAVAAFPNGDTADSTNASNTNLHPPGESPRRQSRRLSSLLFEPLNRRRMQDASPEERIQALRQYRQRTRSSSGEREPESRRRRISSRLQTALLGRDRNGSAEASRTVTPTPGMSASTLPSNADSSHSHVPTAGMQNVDTLPEHAETTAGETPAPAAASRNEVAGSASEAPAAVSGAERDAAEASGTSSGPAPSTSER